MGNCKSKNNQLHVIEHGFDATNPSKSAFRYDKSSKQIFFVGDESTAILTGSSESICSFGGSGLEEQYGHSESILPKEEPHHERSLLEDIVEYLENDDESTVQTQTTCSKSSPDSNGPTHPRTTANDVSETNERKSMDNSVISINLEKDLVSPLAIDNGNFDKLKGEEEIDLEVPHPMQESENEHAQKVEDYNSYLVARSGSTESNFFYCSSSDSGDTNSFNQLYALDDIPKTLNHDSDLIRTSEALDIINDESSDGERNVGQEHDTYQHKLDDALENVSYGSYQDIATTLDQAMIGHEKDENYNDEATLAPSLDGKENIEARSGQGTLSSVAADNLVLNVTELGPELDHGPEDDHALEENLLSDEENFDDDETSVKKKEIEDTLEKDSVKNLEGEETFQNEKADINMSPLSNNEDSNSYWKNETYAVLAEEARLEVCNLKEEVEKVISPENVGLKEEFQFLKHADDKRAESNSSSEIQLNTSKILCNTSDECSLVHSHDCAVTKVTQFQVQIDSDADFDYLENEIGNSMSSDTSPLVSPVSDTNWKPAVDAKSVNRDLTEVQRSSERTDNSPLGGSSHQVSQASPLRNNFKSRESAIPRISLNSPLKSNSPYKGDRPTHIPPPSKTPPRQGFIRSTSIQSMGSFAGTNTKDEARSPFKVLLNTDNGNDDRSFDSHDSSIPRISVNSPMRSRSPYRGDRPSKIPTPSKTPHSNGLKLPSPASSMRNIKSSIETPASQSIGVNTTTSASSAMSNFSEITVDSLPFDEAPAQKEKTRKNRVSNRKSNCSGKWEPYLFFEKHGCERCLSLATVSERDAFFYYGKHDRVTNTCGGCHRLCNKYSGPRFYDDDAVHMCRLCFHATHSKTNVSRNLSTDYA